MTISAIDYETRSSAARWPWSKASLCLGTAAALLMSWVVAYSHFIVGPAYTVAYNAASGAPSAAVTAAYDHYSFLKIFAVAGFIAMWFLSAAGVITGLVGFVKNSRRNLAVTGMILSACPWLFLMFIA